MRSIKAALVILAVLIVGASVNSVVISKKLRDMDDLVRQIPAEIEEMQAQTAICKAKIGEIYHEWDRLMPYLAYVCSYTELNRADEAILELCGSIETGTYEDAVVARSKLLDALRRIRDLEGISPCAVF